jgi:hypothetical protein
MSNGIATPDRIQEAFDASIGRRYPAATLTRDPVGSYRIVVPAVPVAGFSEPTVDVTFDLPVGFPLACPDGFKTSPIRLWYGGLPRWTDILADDSLLWYHHLSHWSPNRDGIINYWGTILRRLASAAAGDSDRDAPPVDSRAATGETREEETDG